MIHPNQDHQERTCTKWKLFWITGLAMAVSVMVLPEAWALQATPTTLTFQAVEGGTNPASQVVKVIKQNNHMVIWRNNYTAPWLSVSPTSGILATAEPIAVSVNTAGLAAGTYTATVTVSAQRGGSVSVPVTLIVTATTTSSGTGRTATLTWNPGASSGVTGYKVHMGTSSGVYSSSIDVGNLTSYALSSLSAGSTYYIAVTAYNASGIDSGFSNEVSKSIY
jgi:hypothetical protein